jgi:cysteine desulfuration protein SufE
MKTINDIQNEIIDEFEGFEDWMDKYSLIMDMASTLSPLAEEYKNDQNLIEGCQSRVWLHAEYVDGKIIFKADSDALIVKGIVAMLINTLSGHSPKEILDCDLYFIEKIGLKENLSPTRSNGLASMVKQMKLYALAYETKNNGHSSALRTCGFDRRRLLPI